MLKILKSVFAKYQIQYYIDIENNNKGRKNENKKTI